MPLLNHERDSTTAGATRGFVSARQRGHSARQYSRGSTPARSFSRKPSLQPHQDPTESRTLEAPTHGLGRWQKPPPTGALFRCFSSSNASPGPSSPSGGESSRRTVSAKTRLPAKSASAISSTDGAQTRSSTTTTAAAADPTAVAAIYCYELPARNQLPFTEPQRVSAIATGGRLDLQNSNLSALPCLHLRTSSIDSGAVDGHSADPTAAGDSSMTVEAIADFFSPHGSGDAAAGRLHAINLRGNSIASLLPNAPQWTATSFDDIPVPESKQSPLRLSANSAIPRSTSLAFYTHVSSLDLTDNKLTSLEGVGALRCLRSLRVARNRLTSLSPLWAGSAVAELEVLDASFNILTTLLTDEDLNRMKSHQIRVITHPTQSRAMRDIRHDHSSTTASLRSMRLRVLYVANNAIEELPSAIYSFSCLTDLRLGSNNIQHVPEQFPSRSCHPLLSRLDLSLNLLSRNTVEVIRRRAAVMSPAAPRISTRPLLSAEGGGTAASSPYNRCNSSSSGGSSATHSESFSLSIAMREDNANERVESTPPLPPTSKSEKEMRESAADMLSSMELGSTKAGSTSAELCSSSSPARSSDTERYRLADNAVGQGAREELSRMSPPLSLRQRTVKRAPAVKKAAIEETVTDCLTPAEGGAAAASLPSGVRLLGDQVYEIQVDVLVPKLARYIDALANSMEEDADTGHPQLRLQQLLAAMSVAPCRTCSGGVWTLSGKRLASPPFAKDMAAAFYEKLFGDFHICFLEDAMPQASPTLILSGLSPTAELAATKGGKRSSAAAPASPLQPSALYEVLCRIIIQMCLQSVKSPPEAAAATTTTRSEAAGLRSSRAVHLATRTSPSVLKRRIAAGRRPRFPVGLQCIHVFRRSKSDESKLPFTLPPSDDTAFLWTYMRWRDSWEAAAAGQPCEVSNTYLMELADPHASLAPIEVNIATAKAHALKSDSSSAAPPVACPALRLWPATCVSLPNHWSTFYAVLHRRRSSGGLPLVQEQSRVSTGGEVPVMKATQPAGKPATAAHLKDVAGSPTIGIGAHVPLPCAVIKSIVINGELELQAQRRKALRQPSPRQRLRERSSPPPFGSLQSGRKSAAAPADMPPIISNAPAQEVALPWLELDVVAEAMVCLELSAQQDERFKDEISAAFHYPVCSLGDMPTRTEEEEEEEAYRSIEAVLLHHAQLSQEMMDAIRQMDVLPRSDGDAKSPKEGVLNLA